MEAEDKAKVGEEVEEVVVEAMGAVAKEEAAPLTDGDDYHVTTVGKSATSSATVGHLVVEPRVKARTNREEMATKDSQELMRLLFVAHPVGTNQEKGLCLMGP